MKLHIGMPSQALKRDALSADPRKSFNLKTYPRQRLR